MNSLKKTYKILFEASKLYEVGQDGVKRYVSELLKELYLQTMNDETLQIDLLLGKHIIPIEEYFFENHLGEIEKKGSAIANDIFLFKEGLIMNLLSRYFSGSIKLFRQKAFDFYYSRYYPVMLSMLTRLGKGKYKDLILKIECYDLVHVALPQNILFFKNIKGQFVTTLHDISHIKFPKYHTRDNIKRAEKGIQLCLDKKSKFIAVSQATETDVIKQYSITKDEIKTIYEGVNLNLFYPRNKEDDFEILNQKYRLNNKRYFLSLGTLEPRKNLIKTIDAFLELEKEINDEIYLIVVGGKGWKNRKIKKQLNIKSNKIFFLGFIPDEHLRYFYIHALALVYPSIYEGFGLPLLEAMACGRTVVYGNNSSMPEVVLKGGIAVNEQVVSSLKSGMLEVLNNDLRKKLEENAFNRALELTWDETARNTLNYYKKIIAISENKFKS